LDIYASFDFLLLIENVVMECQAVFFLKGNSNKAKKKLNWKPKYNIHLLIKDMLNNEYN
jgi:GDP-D-mannose dehydratase